MSDMLKEMKRKIREAKAEYILYCRKKGETFEEIGKRIPNDKQIGISKQRCQELLEEYFLSLQNQK